MLAFACNLGHGLVQSPPASSAAPRKPVLGGARGSARYLAWAPWAASTLGAARLRRLARPAKWSSWSAGHGIELHNDDAIAKRVDHYTRPEGHCIVVSDHPIVAEDRGTCRDFYAEVKIENDVDTWSSGLDMGISRLTPDEIGKLNESDLCWADFPDTWVLRGDGLLRINGRAYPPGVLPSQATTLSGWNTASLEIGDTCGLQVTAGGSELVGFRNGEVIGRLKLEDEIKVPLDADLYLVADVIGRAGEVEILDCTVPASDAPPPPAPAAASPIPPPPEGASAAIWAIMQRRPPMYRDPPELPWAHLGILDLKEDRGCR